jgi:Flp pilus assembly protein CpaB
MMRQRLWVILALLAVLVGVAAFFASRQKVEPIKIEDQTSPVDPTQEDQEEEGLSHP